MQLYRVTAEVNWDASHYEVLDVPAKSVKKAEALATKELEKRGFSHIHTTSVISLGTIVK